MKYTQDLKFDNRISTKLKILIKMNKLMKNKYNTHSIIHLYFSSEPHIYNHNTQKNKHTVESATPIAVDKAYLLGK